MHAELELTLSKDEIQKQIPYAFICTTRSSQVWYTMRRKVAWVTQFTSSERAAAKKLFQQAYNWYLVTGVPDKIKMSLATRLLWEKLAIFCSLIS